MRTRRWTSGTVTAFATAAGVVVSHDAPTDHLPRILIGSKRHRYSQPERINDVSFDHDGSIRGPQCLVIVGTAVGGIICATHAAAPTTTRRSAASIARIVVVVASRFFQRYPLYGIAVSAMISSITTAPPATPPQRIARHGLQILVQPELPRAGRYLDPLERRADGIEAVQAGQGRRARLSLGRRSRRRRAAAAAAVQRRPAEGRVGGGRGVVRLGRVGIDRDGGFGPVVPSPLFSAAAALRFVGWVHMHTDTTTSRSAAGRHEGATRAPLLPHPLQLLLEKLLLLVGREARRHLRGQSALHVYGKMIYLVSELVLSM